MTEQSPRAIHLAAGEGTRLRPITNDRPKPLVELGGTSLLERNVETMNAAGIDDQLVVTGHCAEQIDAIGYEPSTTQSTTRPIWFTVSFVPRSDSRRSGI